MILLRQLPDIVRAADVAALLPANLTNIVVMALDTGAFVVLTPTLGTSPTSATPPRY